MSTVFENEVEDGKILCYNAFIEDMFTWDNEKFIFNLATEDNNSENGIKISKGEESIFV